MLKIFLLILILILFTIFIWTKWELNMQNIKSWIMIGIWEMQLQLIIETYFKTKQK